jgi:hypothetical protein
MPRNPLGAVILYPIGLVLTGAGLIALGWIAWAFYSVEGAFTGLLWVLQRPDLPLRLNGTPMQVANDMIQRKSLFEGAGLAALVLFGGLGALRAARTQMRPANQSHDGKFEISLNNPQPRAGAPLDGNLRTLKETRPGEIFRLDLSCMRVYSDDDGKDKRDVGHFESRDVKALQGARGSSIPFSFAIPANAPPSEGSTHLERGCYHWALNVYRATALLATGSRFNLTLGPATAADRRAFDAALPAPLKAAVATIAGNRAEADLEPLQPYELDRLRTLSPEQLVLVAQPRGPVPHFWKIVLIVFGAMLVLPIVIFILNFMVGAPSR